MFKVAILAVVAVCLFIDVEGHGRMMEPPQRSSLFRFPEFAHLNPIPNYNDNELFCGGAGVQHGQNGGRCGECGDPWHMPKPRDNEMGGKYATGGYAVRSYRPGQTVRLDIDLTTSHLGYFEFNLCEQNFNPNAEEESCFAKHPLRVDGSGYQFPITGPSGHYYPNVVMPDITCEHCVLRWNYRAGNTWGDCGNGTSAAGCGPQETFRNCADIKLQ